MNLYERYVLPHLIDYTCGMGEVMKLRSQLVPQAHGEVLEIGIGTGLNLGFYDPARVSRIVGVDPAAQMQAMAQRRAAGIAIPVEMLALELGRSRRGTIASTASSVPSRCAASPTWRRRWRRCAGCSSPAGGCCSPNTVWRRMPAWRAGRGA